VEQIPGDGGVFDVEAGGTLLYSKHETGRHIRDNEEVLAKIRAISGPRDQRSNVKPSR
jgi:hypothetical protein